MAVSITQSLRLKNLLSVILGGIETDQKAVSLRAIQLMAAELDGTKELTPVPTPGFPPPYKKRVM